MSSGAGQGTARKLVAVSVAILCSCAMIAIALILSGSEIDEGGGRALGTAAALAAASLMASACLMLVRRRPALAAFGYLGVLAAGVTLLLCVGVIWDQGNDPDLGRLFGIALVLALACAHASLLLATAREGETDTLQLVRVGTLGAMALLGVLLCVEIAEPGPDISWRAVGVLAVLYLLGTLLLPLMGAGRRAATPESAPPTGGATVPSAEQLDEAIERLRGQGFVVVAGPAPTQGARGQAVGVSLRDRDGRLFELIAY